MVVPPITGTRITLLRADHPPAHPETSSFDEICDRQLCRAAPFARLAEMPPSVPEPLSRLYSAIEIRPAADLTEKGERGATATERCTLKTGMPNAAQPGPYSWNEDGEACRTMKDVDRSKAHL
jgi:hypothetical protein